MNLATRRAFLGSSAALGLCSTLTVVGQAAAAGQDGHGQAASEPDWALAHITAEAARLARELHAAPRPELMLALAANLRLFGSYSSAHRLDAAARDALRTAIDTYGRDAVIARATAPETVAHMRRTLDGAGVVKHATTIERRIYEQQLDVMLQAGSTIKTLDTSAAVLEAAYADWISRTPSTAGGRLLRVQDWDRIFRCAHLKQQCDYYDSQANYWCAMTFMVPPLAAVCAAHGLSAAGYCFAAQHYGC